MKIYISRVLRHQICQNGFIFEWNAFSWFYKENIFYNKLFLSKRFFSKNMYFNRFMQPSRSTSKYEIILNCFSIFAKMYFKYFNAAKSYKLYLWKYAVSSRSRFIFMSQVCQTKLRSLRILFMNFMLIKSFMQLNITVKKASCGLELTTVSTTAI